MILAGIDEAGYGPMLGPLVISATLFRVAEPRTDAGTTPDTTTEPDAGAEAAAEAEPDATTEPAPPDLWERLAPAVGRRRKDGGVPVGDSKKLFHQGKGLGTLEEGILPFLRLRCPELPGDLRALLEAIARRGEEPPDAYLDGYPWYRGETVRLPKDTFPPVVRRLSERLASRLDETGTEFLGMATLPVEVAEFNRRVEGEGNKARASFGYIALILRRLWKQFPAEDVHVLVDRQGGRTHYAPTLFEAIRPRGVRILEEGDDGCSYLLSRPGDERTTGAFRVTFAAESDERHFPVALASMLSKYLRELHMILFNRFWVSRQPGLRPTAGYVTDARRFLAETVELRARLGVDDGWLIRSR